MTHSHISDLTQQTTKRLALSLGLTLAFVILEISAGILSSSLALLTDAAHNFTDVIALGLSWYAVRIATRPANAGKTYGYHRVGILVALVNSTTLIIISFGIFYEAWQRLISTPEVNSVVLTSVAALAFIVNVGTAWIVQKGSENDLNLRSAFVHLMGDALSTVGAVIAGIVIYFTKWNWLDPAISAVIGILILWNAWTILRQTIHILLESTPENIDMQSMVTDLESVDGVRGVHDLHVWSINESLRILSAHVTTDDVPISLGNAIQRGVNEVLLHKYNIQHATLQLECEGCESSTLYCDISDANHVHEHS